MNPFLMTDRKEKNECEIHIIVNPGHMHIEMTGEADTLLSATCVALRRLKEAGVNPGLIQDTVSIALTL